MRQILENVLVFAATFAAVFLLIMGAASMGRPAPAVRIDTPAQAMEIAHELAPGPIWEGAKQ